MNAILSVLIIDNNPQRAKTLSQILSKADMVNKTITDIPPQPEGIVNVINKYRYNKEAWLIAHRRNISSVKNSDLDSIFGSRVLRYTAEGDNIEALRLVQGDEYKGCDWKAFFDKAKSYPNRIPLWLLVRAEFLELIERFAPLSFVDAEDDGRAIVSGINAWLNEKKNEIIKGGTEWEKSEWKKRLDMLIEQVGKEQNICTDTGATQWIENIKEWLNGKGELSWRMVIPVGVARGFL